MLPSDIFKQYIMSAVESQYIEKHIYSMQKRDRKTTIGNSSVKKIHTVAAKGPHSSSTSSYCAEKRETNHRPSGFTIFMKIKAAGLVLGSLFRHHCTFPLEKTGHLKPQRTQHELL